MEARLFPEGTIPDYTTAEWYVDREAAPHVDQALHRPRIDAAVQMVLSVYRPGMSVVDLGSGDGGMLSLPDRYVAPHEKWGYDLAPANVESAAQRGQDVRYANVLVDQIDLGDIAVTTEMLEHLVDPHGYVAHLSQHVDYLVASSPAFETAESHYGYHAWAWDVDGYAQMINSHGFTVINHQIVGMFQVALARSNRTNNP